jgi:hypothetical protein
MPQIYFIKTGTREFWKLGKLPNIFRLLIFQMALLLISCNNDLREPDAVWRFTSYISGTHSSPRATDLNQDGVKDIVFGAGEAEWMQTPNGIVALDGKTGALLWKVPARNQVVGSPLFIDINQDGVPDVVIGGRSAQLMAIDGKSGNKIWDFLPNEPQRNYQDDTTILNFFTPQFIPDQDQDGLQELLTAYGGYVKAEPGDPERPAGMLKIISSASGRELRSISMPDGKETYFTPVLYNRGPEFPLGVIFGSGGETLAGNLYLADLQDVQRGDLTKYRKLAYGNGKGFIAPPILVDLNKDSIPEIVINSFDSRLIAIDGRNLDIIWETSAGDGLETSSMPSPGFFNDDDVVDFFGNYGLGKWPKIEKSIQVFFDGKTGKIISADSIGGFQFSSRLVLRKKGEKTDIVLYSVNESYPINLPVASGQGEFYYCNNLRIFDLIKKTNYPVFSENFDGTNPASTPLLEDLDQDGRLDLVYIYMTDKLDFFRNSGFRIMRYKLPDSYSTSWGSYMGSTFDSRLH